MKLHELKSKIKHATEENWQEIAIAVLQFLKDRKFTNAKVDEGLETIINFLKQMENEYYYDLAPNTLIAAVGAEGIEPPIPYGEIPGEFERFEIREEVLWFIGTEPPTLTDSFAGTHPALPPHK